MKYTIQTLGCKVNQFETQAMEALLASHGHSPTQAGDADAVIVNTCAVTAESGRKSRQALRRLLGENPGAVAAVCGCYSQLSPEDAEELGASVIFGSGDRAAFVAAVEKAVTERQRARSVDDPFRRTRLEPLPAGAMDGRTRAYMKIEDGCDNFCAYCVIPYARGRVRSMPLDRAAAEAARLEREGFLELVVSGIEISSYGKDFRDGSGLADVVCAIASAAPGTRIRLGSLEPTVVTEAFCRRLRECGNICPQFHLSLQSGCDRTLAAMRRKYDTARFRESAALLRAAFPGCALTADLIAGFPGETEEDFAQTLAFLEEIGFASMHIFPYSPRPGTPAAAMPEQLPRAVKAARARRAQALADALEQRYLQSQVGRTLSVLFETEKDGLWQGHSENYCLVRAEGADMHGIMRNAKILAVQGQNLVGLAL
ncbi:MAG: tRNA (N(6)-L-threonylcarbamoyladenosine(37)-C(2))-methylthiotransferase MtaB [Oscillospiraceae bacterium]|nr:tRNA (N(6)-L-threonylcarbamoyladenosine(37)-C(2))-methylthiotransferase MtaB [Oscillospiraceae bacterium]MBQ2633284.1 tRNA (N(6)-L-threonylcarbamoyladenosine(37)-C(2))-methylthiotransferase MtaB [Oscillospiraceae bacterium]